MMSKLPSSVLAAAILAAPALGQPNEWSDDFSANSTYDSAALLAPCYGGPPPKYTVFEGVITDIFNERAVSGGGTLVFANRALPAVTNPGSGAWIRQELISVGWFGLGIGCPGEPPPLTTAEPFTSPDVCIYGAYRFNPWTILQANGTPKSPGGCTQDCPGYGQFGVNGADGQPGAANVDDDGDGTTDELDESPNRWPIAGSGYGPPFPGGPDGAPGIAGVDDDADGTIDDVGETSWPGSDDGDDGPGRIILSVIVRGNPATSSGMFANVDVTSTGGDLFAIRDLRGLIQTLAEGHNEITPGFYRADTGYNYVFCNSGTCFGAMMWIENDLANPQEVLGPLVSTNHTGPIDDATGLVASTQTATFLREVTFSGNNNFSETFWVVSGLASNADFTKGIFGYPSPSADLDNDRDVDVNDFLTFSGCFAGSLVPPAGGCQNAQADLDGDGDVDVNDFLTFSSCFNGSLTRPSAACFPPDLTACGS